MPALSTGRVKGWTANTRDHMHTAASGSQHTNTQIHTHTLNEHKHRHRVDSTWVGLTNAFKSVVVNLLCKIRSLPFVRPESSQLLIGRFGVPQSITAMLLLPDWFLSSKQQNEEPMGKKKPTTNPHRWIHGKWDDPRRPDPFDKATAAWQCKISQII